jgi:hypothetical protein
MTLFRSGRTIGHVLALTGVLAFLARAAGAALSCTTGPEVQWTPGAGGNGHFYQAVCAASTWDQADAAAVAAGRHLATITSTEENAFVFSLIDDQNFWSAAATNYGPWIGGFQPAASPEPAGGWSWVTGEAFGFTAWYATEPNNNGAEDRIMFYDGTGGAVRSAQWADVPATLVMPYVVEWQHSLDADGDGEVEPLTDGLLVLRDLFGFTGATLTTAAVDLADCTRCDAAAIEPFLDTAVAGRVYDVGQDWSDAANPSGPWSYLQGTTALPHVDSWVPGSFSMPQPAWATAASGSGHIPAFFKSIEPSNDWLAGDIVVHSRDDVNGAGLGDARLRFNTPATGFYRAALEIWIGRDIGRSVGWQLLADGSQQASGTVASGDVFSRASPDGATASLFLAAGEPVDLLLTTAGSFGDLTGVRLRLEAFGLDVDGDGETLPLTDGLLVLRYLFGFTGSTLTTGAVDLVNCTRCDAAAIIGFLDAFD